MPVTVFVTIAVIVVLVTAGTKAVTVHGSLSHHSLLQGAAIILSLVGGLWC